MSIAKIIEVIGEGKSIEEAVQATLSEVNKTLHNVKQIDLEHVEAIVEKDRIAKYRVRSKVSFIVDSNRQKD